MSNAASTLRSLAVYAVCLPLALYLGYLLAMPMGAVSFTFVVIILCLPLIPILLRWHHLFLVLSWNMGAVLFFLPGRPNVWLVMAILSLGLSVVHNILDRDVKAVRVPSLTRPLLFLALVVLVTARFTGGISLRSFGGDAFGGKRYVLIFGAILGYFALARHRIPRERAALYVALFFLSGVSTLIGDIGPLLDPSLYFIFLVFPVENLEMIMQGGFSAVLDYGRFGGLATACLAAANFILARHGLRGVFDLGERWRFLPLRFRGGLAVTSPWRLVLLMALLWTGLWMGGYRATLISAAILLLLLFYFEGLHRTALLPALVVAGALVAAVAAPLANRLPYTIQRAISFLPVDIDPVARYSAEVSSEWRLRIWQLVLPQVPKYLLLGKGFGINAAELAMAQTMTQDTEEGTILVGDYHNGPLSVVIPLGIYGLVGFLWFLIASIRVLLNNCRYGDPALLTVNNFLLASFVMHVILFFVIFGSFYGELFTFTGIIGFAVSLNGHVTKPVPAPAPKPAFNQFKLARVAS